jgi:hypothetical protein
MTRLVTPACSSPPSVVQRLRAAARSPMGGVSWPATRRWSRRSPRALRRVDYWRRNPWSAVGATFAARLAHNFSACRRKRRTQNCPRW